MNIEEEPRETEKIEQTAKTTVDDVIKPKSPEIEANSPPEIEPEGNAEEVKLIQ